MKKNYLLLLMLLFSFSLLNAENIEWKGTVDQNWNLGGNWEFGAVPTVNDDVTIPQGFSYTVDILNSVEAVCNNLTIVGSTVNLDGTLIVTSALTNNNSTIQGNGAVKAGTYAGTGSTIFNIATGDVANGYWVAATNFKSGASDDDWFTADNWTNGVPTSTTAAAITYSGSYTVSVNNATETAVAKDLYINPGSSLNLVTELSLIVVPGSESFVCGENLEYAGETYPTVDINDKCWLVKNLNVGTMDISGTNQDEIDGIQKWCPNDDIDECSEWGGYYQWKEIMQGSTQEGAQGICPENWHIPTKAEYDDIVAFGFSATKEPGTSHWNTDNGLSTTFLAFGGGFMLASTTPTDQKIRGQFWTSKDWDGVSAYAFELLDAGNIHSAFQQHIAALSVRCVKDTN